MFESQKQILFSNPHSLVYPRKLDTALRDSTCKELLKMNTELNDKMETSDKDAILFFLLLDEYIPDWRINMENMINKNIWPKILLDLFASSFKKKNNTNIDFVFLKECVHRNLRIQLSSMYNQVVERHITENIQLMETWLDRMSIIPFEVRTMMEFSHTMSDIVEGMGKRTKNIKTEQAGYKFEASCGYKNIDTYNRELSILWSGKYCYIKYDEIEAILPSAYILLIHNKASDLVSVLLYAMHTDESTLEANSYHDTCNFIRSFSESATKNSCSIYDVLRSLEGLVVGLTLRELEGMSNSTFMTVLCEDISRIIGTPIYEQAWFHILEGASIPFRHELGCLSKVFGHPFVDMEKGSEKLRLNTTADNEICEELVNKSVASAARSFIKSFILRNKKWPSVNVTTLSDRLKTAYNDNKDPDAAKYVRRYGSTTSIDEYRNIELLPCEHFIQIENYIPYLKDKTISLFRSEVFRQIIKPANGEGEDMPERFNRNDHWKNTRVLLYFLLNTEDKTDHSKYVAWWLDEQPDYRMALEMLVMRIVPKEKELKTLFRGFGCRTFPSRIISHIMLQNTGVFLDKYSNEQAMTLNELEILSKLDSFRRIHEAYRNVSPVYMTIDVSAWNNNFRKEAVDPVTSKILGAVFGNQLFNKVQEQYENTLIYVPDHAKCYWWDGQKGGIEGQNQYEWDLVYLAQIHVALEECGFEYFIFCKGDDVRVVLLVPHDRLENRTLDSFRDIILQKLKNTLSRYGHKINPIESYASLSYFAFSKSASIGLIELPQAFRKIQKCYGANNALLPFLDDYIATSYSNAHSACHSSTNFLAPYCVALYWSYYHLLKSPQFRSLSQSDMVGLLLVPSMLGGFPIIYLHNMMVRSESDLLSPFLYILANARVVDPEVYDKMSGFMKVIIYDDPKAILGLLTDPFSLAIMKPLSAKTVFKNSLIPALKKITKNEKVRECFKALEGDYLQELVEALATCNVYNSRILSAIFASTPHGFLESLLAKFESGRSVIEVLLTSFSRKQADFWLRKTIKADIRINNYRLNRLSNKYEDNQYDLNALLKGIDCPAQAASIIRKFTWKKDVESVTMPPLQHQLIIADIDAALANDYAKKNYFEAMMTGCTQELKRHNLPAFSAGKYKPFLGHKTKTGMIQKTVTHFVEKNELLTKVKNLLDLISWCRMTDGNIDPKERVEGNFDILIRKILPNYINVDLNSIYAFRAERKSGTVTHHIRSPGFREEIMPNILSNIYTRFRCNTNTNTTVRNSTMHYTINYLHILCYAVGILNFRFCVSNLNYNAPFKFALIIAECPHCIKPIQETPMRADARLLNNINMPNVSALHVGREAERILRESMILNTRRFQHNAQSSTVVPLMIAMRGLSQLLCQSSFSERVSINDYTFKHVMTAHAEGIVTDLIRHKKRSPVGQNELKSVYPKEFYYAMLPLITWYIITEMNDCPDAGFTSRAKAIPGTELPWYPMVTDIYNLGKMPHLINEVSNITDVRYSNIEESPQATATYLLLASRNFPETLGTRNYPLVLMTYFDSSVVLPYIRRHYYIKLKRLIDDKIFTNFMTRLRRGSTDTDILTNMGMVLVSCVLGQLHVDFEKEICSDVDELGCNQAREVVLHFEHNEIDLEMDLETLIEDSPLIGYYFNKGDVKEVTTPESVWNYLLDNPATFVEIREWVLLHLNKCSVAVWYIDYNAAVSRVRSAPVVPIHLQLRNPEPADNVVVLHVNPNAPRPQTLRHCAVSFNTSSQLYTSYEEYWHPEIDHIQEHHFIDHRFFYRFFFRGTTALNKLHDILITFGIEQLPDYANYICLADGFGGFASLINRSVRHSRIVFNTLVSSDTYVEVYPYALLGQFDVRDNAINYMAMQEGHSDLTEDGTVETIISTSRIDVEVVTCDAQTIGMDMINRWKLIRNVSHIYLSLRANNGVLIVKLYMNELKLNARFMGILRMYCNHIHLYKPIASGYNDEVYLVAWGNTQMPFDSNHWHLNRYVPENSLQKIKNFIDSLRREEMTTRYKTNVLRLSFPHPRVLTSAVMYGFDLTLVIRLRELVEIDINREMIRYLEIGDFTSFERTMSTKMAETTREILNQLDRHMPGQRAWDLNTRANAIKVHLRAFRIYGFTDSWDAKIQQREVDLHTSRMFKSYLERAEHIDPGIYVASDDFDIETRKDRGRNLYVGGTQTLYSSYIRGCEVFMQYAAYRRLHTAFIGRLR